MRLINSDPAPGRILDAAEALFADLPFAAVTTRAIARRAGVNIALLPYYFGSKTGVLEAVVARREPELRALASAESARALARYLEGEGRAYGRVLARAAMEERGGGTGPAARVLLFVAGALRGEADSGEDPAAAVMLDLLYPWLPRHAPGAKIAPILPEPSPPEPSPPSPAGRRPGENAFGLDVID
jgi:AcrR family transcriptional regulator